MPRRVQRRPVLSRSDRPMVRWELICSSCGQRTPVRRTQAGRGCPCGAVDVALVRVTPARRMTDDELENW